MCLTACWNFNHLFVVIYFVHFTFCSTRCLAHQKINLLEAVCSCVSIDVLQTLFYKFCLKGFSGVPKKKKDKVLQKETIHNQKQSAALKQWNEEPRGLLTCNQCNYPEESKASTNQSQQHKFSR